MDLSKIKLVVTDMDGTLLNSQNEVSNRFYELYDALKKRDVHFVAASGRQYYSIIDKLAPIKDEITIIAENGGLAKYRDEEIVVTDLPLNEVKKLTTLFKGINDVYPVICGNKNAYTQNNEDYFTAILEKYYSKYSIVDDLSTVKDDIVFKMAVYHFENSEKYIYPIVKHLEKIMQIKVSGHHWVDISHINANKGYALQLVQQRLGIDKTETMVFGDFNNDLEMLACADYSFAMENAHPNVKKTANFLTKSNDDFGVETVLEQLVRAKN